MTGNSVGAVMRPAGPEKAIGIISASFYKDPTDEQWQDTADHKEWLAWMKKYNTSGNISDAFTVIGYCSAETMVAVLRASGDNLTRENVMKQASTIWGCRCFCPASRSQQAQTISRRLSRCN